MCVCGIGAGFRKWQPCEMLSGADDELIVGRIMVFDVRGPKRIARVRINGRKVAAATL